jgi:hypothetical protein
MAERRIEQLFDSLSDLDRALPVTDVTNETFKVLSDRLERSSLPRHSSIGRRSWTTYGGLASHPFRAAPRGRRRHHEKSWRTCYP